MAAMLERARIWRANNALERSSFVILFSEVCPDWRFASRWRSILRGNIFSWGSAYESAETAVSFDPKRRHATRRPAGRPAGMKCTRSSPKGDKNSLVRRRLTPNFKVYIFYILRPTIRRQACFRLPLGNLSPKRKRHHACSGATLGN